MPNSEAALEETLKKENKEFRKLAEEHEDLKKKIQELDKHKFLTPDQETEISRLKKLKLQGKDRMHQILTEHKNKKK